MESYALFEARNQFTTLVRKVGNGPPVEITRHGKSVAILMGIDEYKRLKESHSSFYSKLMDFRKRHMDEELSLVTDCEDPFAQVRALELGRELSW